MRRLAPALLVLALAACAQSPATAPTTPPEGVSGVITGDPIVAARQNAVAFFRAPQAGQPAAAARAFADIEYLADTVPTDPLWQNSSPIAQNGLVISRREIRQGLRIPMNAPSQAVVTGLTEAARALEANDRAAVAAALPRSVFTAGPNQTVRLLAQPIPVRSAGNALSALAAGPSPGRR